MRLLLASVIAGGLMSADIYLNQMSVTRAVLSSLVYPIHWLSDLPSRIGHWGERNLVSRATLLEENRELRNESVMLEARVQQMASLRAENVRLRALLNSSALVQDDVLVAELVGISPDPTRHLVLLNKGSTNGVFLGQPLSDAHGLMGQVVEVSLGHCRVLLLTDASHAIPVQVNRNGVRAIAEGVGRLDQLELSHVALTEDIRVGDLLVSSGLGGRFPAGYPVAEVTGVVRNPSRSFAAVSAKPMAALNRSRHVLLIFTGGTEP